MPNKFLENLKKSFFDVAFRLMGRVRDNRRGKQRDPGFATQAVTNVIKTFRVVIYELS
jgi:hypothetical protein